MTTRETRYLSIEGRDDWYANPVTQGILILAPLTLWTGWYIATVGLLFMAVAANLDISYDKEYENYD
jgi:hypothetical protein